MLSWWVWSEKFDFDFILNVIFTKISGSNLYLIPWERTTLRPFHLRFEDWSELAKTELSIDNEEIQTTIILHLSLRIEKHDLWVCRGSHLLCSDGDFAWVLPCWICQWLLHLLISCCYDLMKSEFQWSNKVMVLEILWFIIITVINFYLVFVILLKMEFSLNLLDPFRVKIVMNYLRLTKLLPHVSFLLEENHKRVRLWECIHVD